LQISWVIARVLRNLTPTFHTNKFCRTLKNVKAWVELYVGLYLESILSVNAYVVGLKQFVQLHKPRPRDGLVTSKTNEPIFWTIQ
jgi:hypothetical protein